MAPEFFIDPPSSITEGAGKTGRRLAPMVRVQQKSTRQNHRLSRNRPAFPAQWFYGLYVLSPVTRLCCHRRRADRRHAQLSASLGAPGPHDFAVRDIVTRLVRYRVHRIPHPTFVTIAKRPSYRRRDAREDGFDLPDGARGKFASPWHDGQFANGTHAPLSRSSLRATRSSESAPGGKLSDAIQNLPAGKVRIASSRYSRTFVASLRTH